MVTAVYAAILACFFVYLSARVIALRLKHKVSIGDGGLDPLARAMRVHANFAEYVPLILILMAFYELGGAPVWALHGVGVALCVARFSHVYGMGVDASFVFRQVGMVVTFLLLLALSALIVLRSFLGG